MFGIFYEDINYAADGGLYAELVRNRSFEFNSSDNGSFTGMTAWDALNRSGAGTHRRRRQRRRPAQRDEPQLPALDATGGRGRHPQRRLQQRLSRSPRRQDVRRLGVGASPPPRRTSPSRCRGRPPAPACSRRGTVAVDGTDTWKKYAVELTATGTTDAGRLAVLAGGAVTVAPRHGLAVPAGHLGRPGQRHVRAAQGPRREDRRDEPGLPALPRRLRHQRRHASTPTRRPATPTGAARTSGRRPSARSSSARPTGTSGATTSPTASATSSTSSSPRTSAPMPLPVVSGRRQRLRQHHPEMHRPGADRPLGPGHRST